MRRLYEEWNPDPSSLAVVEQANTIIEDYEAQGYDLTLRQLYYQFVARDLIPNNMRSYKRLGSLLDRGRKAGLVDWSAIVDRTRNLESLAHWSSPANALLAIAEQYREDLWEDQPTRVEVWVEKEALAGVVERAADAFDCAWFSCRGYVSQSEMWEAGRRFGRYFAAGQNVVVLHLGDHDPSGIDMTRDIRDRIGNFVETDWLYEQMTETSAYPSAIREAIQAHLGTSANPLTINRIALNMDQVEQYDPPPNPAKVTDSRSGPYIAQYGDESWELDALDPATLASLITEHIEALVDPDLYAQAVHDVEDRRAQLVDLSDRYDSVVDFLDEG